ncbi:alpha/beta fold hydrolase [Zobellia uliginosa]|uniref:alpha/beta fold hydrolase n=1 Tax=Zobellia uliginosa TaxID=143224 RepID=UPI001C07D84D|nr:alpha/beta hydrolase [Zobellia uliginosa]MBU2948175.1 alpha/beta fold hydrolase [Zobellia uliginosa]
MRKHRRTKKLILRLSVFAVVFLFFYACASVPKLSDETKSMINQVMREPIPEMITGRTGYAISNGWKIWYESIPPMITKKGTIILVMGAANDALSWPPSFISKFTDAGYEVIRYDHRGTGLTERLKKTDKEYALEDMAEDPIAILDSLNIKKAHIIGVSMGGMISQIATITNENRFESLTSIMSSGDIFDTSLPNPSPDVLPQMISAVLKYGIFGGKKSQIKLQFVHKRILMGEATGNITSKPLAEASLYNLKKRDGYHFIAGRQHQKAMESAKARYDALSKLKVPVLVIHGKQDPVIPFEHGMKMASVIKNVDSLWVDNMGHDLPNAQIDAISTKILDIIDGNNLQ